MFLSGPETDSHIAEAAQRFDLPEAWIRAVMRAESTGNSQAVSPKGAMGLMQIMPGTWAELRARHGLGYDPFDPRDNILAGAAYLREPHDRVGSPGFLAACNAGPGRYGEHLMTERPLPPETRRYVAALAPLIGGACVAGTQRPAAGPVRNCGGGVIAPEVQRLPGTTDTATGGLFAAPPIACADIGRSPGKARPTPSRETAKHAADHPASRNDRAR